MKKVLSPITGTLCTDLLRTYPVKEIIEYYKKSLQLDVTYLFGDLIEIELYKCPDTGYIFFYPGIEGDSFFYSTKKPLSESYMDWKWEHEESLKFINDGDKVLEIGSGSGGFIRGLTKRLKVSVTGLEINPSAISNALLNGVRVSEESLTEHSIKNSQMYDVVCAFQVLEHISDVSGFIQSSVKCLKERGKLIISVPNNESFVGDIDAFSDRPPYHVGRYTKDSLLNIGLHFDLEMIDLVNEPLQEYHFSSVANVLTPKLFGNDRILNKIIKLLGGSLLLNKIIRILSKWMYGHTILIVLSRS